MGRGKPLSGDGGASLVPPLLQAQLNTLRGVRQTVGTGSSWEEDRLAGDPSTGGVVTGWVPGASFLLAGSQRRCPRSSQDCKLLLRVSLSCFWNPWSLPSIRPVWPGPRRALRWQEPSLQGMSLGDSPQNQQYS